MKTIQIKVDQLTSKLFANEHSGTDQKQMIYKHNSPFFSLTLSLLGLTETYCASFPLLLLPVLLE